MNDSTPRGAFNESAPFDTRPLTNQPLSFDPEGTIEVPSGHDTEVFAQTIRDIEEETMTQPKLCRCKEYAPDPTIGVGCAVCGGFPPVVFAKPTPEQPKREAWEDEFAKQSVNMDGWQMIDIAGAIRVVSVALSTQAEELELLNKLVAILSKHCGETGENEGAAATLNRKLAELAQLEERFNAAEQSLERAIIREAEQNTQLTALRDKAQALRDYIVETPVVGFNVPDEIWIPFDALLKEKP